MSGNRPISTDLQNAIASRSVSLTALMKISPVAPGASPIGITKLDVDFTYDDGTDEVTYSAMTGMVPANMLATSSMTVGNSETKGLLLPQYSVPVVAEDIYAGVYDNAAYTVYIIDFEHPEYGHWIPPDGHGVVGRVTVDDRGQSFVMEMTDPTKWLKQSVVDNWSRTCRAIFGSQPLGTGGGVVEEEQPCGFDASTLWSGTQTVTSLGVESTRTFTASGLGAGEGFYVPGLLEWLTGDNAGRKEMVRSQSSGGVISLKFPMYYAVQAGDTFRIRPDCTRIKDGTNGCKDHWEVITAVEWKKHYRGEPFTPVADGDSLTTPGAST